MSQHDFNIANQLFPATRADLNNALVALASNSSGDGEPGTTYANQWWYETDTNTLKLRNEANNAWIPIAVLDQSSNTVLSITTQGLTLGATALTATGAEINKLSGATISTTELNQLDAITRGSILYGNASGVTARLAKGGAGTVLTSDGTDISWAAAGVGSIGVGQSWRADTGRTANTFFHNNSAKAIMVQAYTTGGPIMDVGPATNNTVPIAQYDRDGDLDNPMYVIVPAGHYWRVNGVDHVDSSNHQNILD